MPTILRNLYKKKIQTIKIYHTELLGNLYQLNNIDSIIDQSVKIQTVIKKTAKLLSDRQNGGKLIEKEIQFISHILLDLRTDLGKSISVYEKTLTQTKSEVKNNIH
jgi:hypothetical protein